MVGYRAATVLSILARSHAFISVPSAKSSTQLADTITSYETVDKRTGKRTGTSFLPPETIERAASGNPIEKVKLTKDGTSAFVDMYEYAAKLRSGEMTWEEVEAADMNTRLKFVGMLHRDKRTPDQFLMRLKVPNGKWHSQFRSNAILR